MMNIRFEGLTRWNIHNRGRQRDFGILCVTHLIIHSFKMRQGSSLKQIDQIVLSPKYITNLNKMPLLTQGHLNKIIIRKSNNL